MLDLPRFKPGVRQRFLHFGAICPTRLVQLKPFAHGAIYVWRLVDRKLAELWQEADRVRLMQQLVFWRNRLPGRWDTASSKSSQYPPCVSKIARGLSTSIVRIWSSVTPRLLSAGSTSLWIW